LTNKKIYCKKTTCLKSSSNFGGGRSDIEVCPAKREDDSI
jgi:hypothetical protein